MAIDHLAIEDLNQHLGRFFGWRGALYMPTHRAGQDTEIDPIRYKNLLR